MPPPQPLEAPDAPIKPPPQPEPPRARSTLPIVGMEALPGPCFALRGTEGVRGKASAE